MPSRPVALPLLSALALATTSCGGSPRVSAGGSVASCPTGDVARYAMFHKQSARWSIGVGYRFQDETPPPHGAVSRDAVRALGMLDVPDVVWLYDGTKPACRAQISGFVAEPEDFGFGVSTVVYAVTGDCLPTDEARDAWVLAVAEEPKGCGFAPAAALASVTLDEKDDSYTVPGNRPSVPPPFDLAVQRPDCAPSCPTLWSLRSVESSPRVAEMTVTHLVEMAAPDAPCDWDVADQFGIYLGGGPGVAPRELVLPPDARGQEQPPMSLSGAFVDGTGPRIVALVDIATWAAYSITADATYGAGNRVQYNFIHEEYWHRSLAPYCGP